MAILRYLVPAAAVVLLGYPAGAADSTSREPAKTQTQTQAQVEDQTGSQDRDRQQLRKRDGSCAGDQTQARDRKRDRSCDRSCDRAGNRRSGGGGPRGRR